MAGQRKRGRPTKNATQSVGEQEEEEIRGHSDALSGYEQFRQKRIKENEERLKKMGILDLSKKLKSEVLPPKPSKRIKISKPSLPPNGSPRRSSRLTTMTRLNYAEKGRSPKKEGKSVRNIEIKIEEGSEPEVYTEVHEQLLGDCKTNWTLYVDGYGQDGQRMYDPVEGKSCHQCRQKTLGHHTECSTCKTVQGQFCGDCLYMRYGENVIEANENTSWTCPVCRGICNCSRCRRNKGWCPTGSIYRKIKELGFKSVAHYLILTRGPQKIQVEPTEEDPNSANGPFANGESESSDETSKARSDCNRGEEVKEETENGVNSDATDEDGNHEHAYAVNDDDDDDNYEPSEE